MLKPLRVKWGFLKGLVVLIVLMCCNFDGDLVNAHRPGEEYQYKNMFLDTKTEPVASEGFPGDLMNFVKTGHTGQDQDNSGALKRLQLNPRVKPLLHAPEAFRGVGGVEKGSGENITKVTYMLFKLIREYKIKSMIDVPCRGHLKWMSHVLERVDYDEPEFHYFCMDTNEEVLKTAKARVGDLGNAKFVNKKFWKVGLPKADLLFAWSGLHKMRKESIYKMLKKVVKKKSTKYVLIGNYPDAKDDEAEDENEEKAKERDTEEDLHYNLRKHPFKFERPMRIISKLTEGDVPNKQMLMYETTKMRKNW